MSHVSKILSIILLSFSIAFCGGDSKNQGNNPVVLPSCEITGQVYNPDEEICQCPGEQFLNADSTACVSACLEGEVKPTKSEKCQMAMTCTGGKILDPSTNTCIDRMCSAGEVLDITVDPFECISILNCRSSANKFLNTDFTTCITKSTCTTVASQVANASGYCEVCENSTPVRSLDKATCIDTSMCTETTGRLVISGDCTDCTELTGNDSLSQVVSLDETMCIDETTCTATLGQANVDGDCTVCTVINGTDGMGQAASPDKTMCIDATTCTNTAGQANVGGDCIDCTSASQVASADKTMCIDKSMCTGTAGQIATTAGDCEVCAAPTPVGDITKTMCIAANTCTDIAGQVNMGGDCIDCTSASQVASADKTMCIGKSMCTGTAGQIATTAGDCEVCAAPTPVRNIAKTMCIASNTCTDIAGQVNMSGDCIACKNPNPLTNLNKSACTDATSCTGVGGIVVAPQMACIMDDDMDGIRNTEDDCPSGVTSAATTSDRTVATADPDMDGCKNSEDDDDDGDGTDDALDVFPYNECASTDTDSDGNPDTVVMGCLTGSLTEDNDDDDDSVLDNNDACPTGELNMASGDDTDPTADPDGDGCKNSEDVDEDNNGLIDIATAVDLNNMRHDLAGKSYDDEADDGAGNEGDTSGAPTRATRFCPEETSVGSGIYLCGYELVDDIDFAGPDGDPTTTIDNLDLNDTTAGNFDLIGDNTSGHFTAYLEGNRYIIQNLHIDTTGSSAANDDANDAALFASCRGVINALILENPKIRGRGRISVLCATMNNSTITNVRIEKANVATETSSSSSSNYVGTLAAYMQGSSLINSSAATGGIATGGISSYESTLVLRTYVGRLVGWMQDSSIINNSYATGNVATRANIAAYAGGLVGWMQDSSNVDGSYATSNVSSAISNTVAVVYAGGLVGNMIDSSSISDSYATGDVASNSSSLPAYAGGLVGNMTDSSSIRNSYAAGDTASYAYAYNRNFIGSFACTGGLVGYMTDSSSISNSYAAGNTSASATGTSFDIYNGGLVGFMGPGTDSNSISKSYYNSESVQMRNGITRRNNREVGSERRNGVPAVTATALSDIQRFSASTLGWDGLNQWFGILTGGTAGRFPLLRYSDNPHTADDPDTPDTDESLNECEFLRGQGNNRIGLARCGAIQSFQEVYRAGGNLVFTEGTSNNVRIGRTTRTEATSATPEFFYFVNAATVTATYNLATNVTLMASGVEQEDGTANTDVTWTEGTTAGTISGIDEGETFWLSLTFQEPYSHSPGRFRTHKVRWKFVMPSS